MSGENVGVYGINQGDLALNSGNYDLSYQGNNLTITKALLNVIADAKTKVYGDADPSLTYQVSGLKNGDTAGAVLNGGSLSRVAGALMGGYADDLFYLLFRILTQRMIEDGYRPNARGSMAPAAMSFMRDHGVLKDIYTERDGDSHKTARGKKLSVRTVKAPGFGPKAPATRLRLPPLSTAPAVSPFFSPETW